MPIMDRNNPKGDRRRRSSLLLRFGVISAVLTGLLAAVLTAWLTGFIRTSNIAHARDTATYSVGLALGALNPRSGDPATQTAAQLRQTTLLLHSAVATGKFVGAVAWASPDLIVYADEPERIGRHERPPIQVTAALGGHQITAVVTRPQSDGTAPTERAALQRAGPLLEIFTPVRLGNHVVAVVVLYQPWQPIRRLITREIRQMLLLVVAGLAVLWLGLMRLMLSASRKLRAQAEANWELASHDSLTRLPNRKLLRERVQQALAMSERSGHHVGLLLFDLDRFKEVNDALGHHAGDLLLEQIGPRLANVLRGSDSVARLGGDEFVVLLPDLVDPVEAVATARRLTAALEVPFWLDGASLDVGASIGIAISPADGTDFDALLRHADSGMYGAKHSAAGAAAAAAGSDSNSIGQLAMLGQLRKALHGPSQFILHYQPQADLVTGQVQRVEAIVRWQHPARGLLSPAEFVPLAEQTGLILPLTFNLLKAALTQIQQWDRQGLRLGAAVNISTRCLLDTTFPGVIRNLLREYQAEPGRLELKITESVIMADRNRATAALAGLTKLGVRLVVDEFGTGYSPLAYLKQLPVHQLNIDKSFVTGMVPGSTDAAIVCSCIELARDLGISALAEGVDTRAVWDQLTQFGCHLAQGSYVGQPMTALELGAWMAKRTQRLRPGIERVPV